MNSITLNVSRLKKITATFLTWSLLASLLVGINFSFNVPIVKAVAAPSCTTNAPGGGFSELLGNAFTYEVTLNNTGDLGYRPVIELVLPPEVQFVSANHEDSSLAAATTSIIVPANGEETHPITGEEITSLTPDYTFVLIEYPLGSLEKCSTGDSNEHKFTNRCFCCSSDSN